MSKDRFKYQQGRLYLHKTNLSMLMREYGTPLYCYDAQKIRENVGALKKALDTHYPNNRICYSIKANGNVEILKLLQQEGLFADCSSAVEVFLAKKAGFDLTKCINTSVNPTAEDLEWAMKNKLIINLDHISQLQRVLDMGRPHTVSFRINPQISVGKYEQIKVGSKDSKFGISPEDAILAYRKASRAGIMHFGIHMMMGSCILDASQFLKGVKKLLKVAVKLKENLGIQLDFIDVGGGIGIPYERDEKHMDLNALAKGIAAELKAVEGKIGTPTLIMEPGRFLVGESGILLTHVNTIKEVGDLRFVGVDASMSNFLRPMLYGAQHKIMAVKQRPGRPLPHVVVGPVCENTDCFSKDAKLPKVQEGDALAILDVGAYGYAMASQYNGRLRPAEILLDGGKHSIIRRREEMKDLLL